MRVFRGEHKTKSVDIHFSSDNLSVIRPDNRFDTNHIDALIHLFKELSQFRPHIRTIFGRDFQASYRGTNLGIFWNFAIPILPISVYLMLATFRVVPSFEGIPSAVAISFNAMIWFFLAGCVQQPVNIVKSRNVDAMKTSLPLSVSIASSFARLMFDTLVRSGLVIFVILYYHAWPQNTTILALIVFVCATLTFLGIGLFLAIINIVVPDIERIVTILLQYGLFLSGVIFPLSSFGPLSFLEIVNPFAAFISALRHLVFLGMPTNILPALVISGLGILLFIYSIRVFYVMEQRIRGVY